MSAPQHSLGLVAHKHVNHNVKLRKSGLYRGLYVMNIIRIINGDIRSLKYNSCEMQLHGPTLHSNPQMALAGIFFRFSLRISIYVFCVC